MKLLVGNLDTVTKGILSKNIFYTCDITLRFTDREIRILEKICENDAAAEKPISRIKFNMHNSHLFGLFSSSDENSEPDDLWDWTPQALYYTAKNNFGNFVVNVKAVSSEQRDDICNQVRELAQKVKKIISV
jgi:hypothetical protein